MILIMLEINYGTCTENNIMTNGGGADDNNDNGYIKVTVE